MLSNPKNYLKMSEATRILKEKRIILPRTKDYSTSILRSINQAPNMNDVQEMYQAIQACCPQYLEDYIWYLKQNKTYLYNMFVMKWDDFSHYCQWLFQILDYIEDRHDMRFETDPYRLRLYGFLSERLIAVWVHHNIDESEIELYSVINVEEKTHTRIRHIIGNYRRNLDFSFYKRLKKTQIVEERLINTITKGKGK